MKINFPTLAEDPAKILGIENVPGLPATYVFGPDGKLRTALYGLQTTKSLQQAMGVR